MIWIPILSATALAGGTLIERILLKRKNMSVKFYETYSFLFIVLVMIPFTFFFWDVSSLAYSLENILILLVVVVLALFANWFIFQSLKWEKISRLEPARMMEPLFTVMLAVIFSYIFGEGLYERNLKFIIPALVAGAALIFSHFRRDHLEFNKYFKFAILGSLFFAAELVVSRILLDIYSPFSFYFVRCILIFGLSFILFRPKLFGEVDNKTILHILLTSFLWVGFRILIYYGYTTLGIIETTLMIMLGPVFVYLFAWKFLKDKPDWRNILSSIIIVLAVVYATVF